MASVCNMALATRLAQMTAGKNVAVGNHQQTIPTRRLHRHIHVKQRPPLLVTLPSVSCRSNPKSFSEMQALRSKLCFMKMPSPNKQPIRTSVTLVRDMIKVGQPPCCQVRTLNKGRQFPPLTGLRGTTSNVGMTGGARKRKWPRYLGALFLLITGSAGTWLVYKLYGYRKRGFFPFYVPKLDLQLFAPLGSYKDTVINAVQLRNVERAQDFVVRTDDVFVISFPRSGTTWTQEVVYLIANNADERRARSDNLEVRFPYLEDPDDNLTVLDSRESPRFIKTHLPFHLLPADLHKKKPKMIYVARNPKDAVVSSYHQFVTLKMGYRGSFEEYCELFLQDKLQFSPWTEHVKKYWTRRDADNILFITYEDMVTNLAQEVEKISKFLNRPLTPEQLETIVSHCSFESMKNNDMVNYNWWDERGFTRNIGTSFIRKGKVGDWKNYFSPELDRRMMEKVERPLLAIGLKVKYEVDLGDSKKS